MLCLFLSINLDSSGYIFLIYMFAVFIHLLVRSLSHEPDNLFSIKHLISAVSNFHCLMKNDILAHFSFAFMINHGSRQ